MLTTGLKLVVLEAVVILHHQEMAILTADLMQLLFVATLIVLQLDLTTVQPHNLALTLGQNLRHLVLIHRVQAMAVVVLPEAEVTEVEVTEVEDLPEAAEDNNNLRLCF
jgi:hypothetical protein